MDTMTTTRRIDMGTDMGFSDAEDRPQRIILIEMPLTADDAGSHNGEAFDLIPAEDRFLRAAFIFDSEGHYVEEEEPFDIEHEGRTYWNIKAASREFFLRLEEEGGNYNGAGRALLEIRAYEAAAATT